MKNTTPLAVFGSTLSENCKKKLSELGFTIFPLPCVSTLTPPLDTHADLSLFVLDKEVFTAKEISKSVLELSEELNKRGYRVFEIDEDLSSPYPKDIPLNCLRVGRYIFSKNAHTAKKLVSEATERGYGLINVNQGYARCTVCPVSDRAIITADSSIAKAAELLDIDVLRIRQGYVKLDGYEYGFIGGASGMHGNTVYFAGDLLSHPDGEKIYEFCQKHGKTAFSLSDEVLTDVGSIFFFPEI